MGNTINYSPKGVQVAMSADVAHLFVSVSVFIYFHFSNTGLHSIFESLWKTYRRTWASQPSVMGRSVNICTVVPSSSCPGRSASHQARRRNTSVRSDGLTVIRVAVFGQQNTGRLCPLPCQSCPVLGYAENPRSVSANGKERGFLKSSIFSRARLPFCIFGKGDL